LKKKAAMKDYKLLEEIYGKSEIWKEPVFKWQNTFSGEREAVHNDFQSSWSTTMKTDEHVKKSVATCFH
jgi:hypothetical protein